MSEETTWNPEELAKKIKEELPPVQSFEDTILKEANELFQKLREPGDTSYIGRLHARCVIVAWLKDALQYWEKKG